ncbi:unnamed protein product [Rotaria sp. Silwood2]|nr:unnamed protein product [Rotaria sp. Silwood2]CAF4634623.1 unnamed protein product [Rotaria sp. Silwood2]
MLLVILSIFIIKTANSLNCSDSTSTLVDWPGTLLSVPADSLTKLPKCAGDLTRVISNHAGPILFVPGTGAKSAIAQFSRGRTLELNKLDWPHCFVDPPDYGFGDIQISGEYIAFSIRTMYECANRHRVNTIGHSQDGMTPRWALRFWPDIRSLVNNMIDLVPVYHGIETITASYP